MRGPRGAGGAGLRLTMARGGRSTVQTMVVTGTVVTWLTWFMIFMAQLHPIIEPQTPPYLQPAGAD